MSNNVCGKCHTFDSMHDYCIIAGDRYANSPACHCFADKCQEITSPTVFDCITQSPEVLAEDFVYESGEMWMSTLIVDTTFETWEEAHAATVAKLKDVAE